MSKTILYDGNVGLYTIVSDEKYPEIKNAMLISNEEITFHRISMFRTSDTSALVIVSSVYGNAQITHDAFMYDPMIRVTRFYINELLYNMFMDCTIHQTTIFNHAYDLFWLLFFSEDSLYDTINFNPKFIDSFSRNQFMEVYNSPLTFDLFGLINRYAINLYDDDTEEWDKLRKMLGEETIEHFALYNSGLRNNTISKIELLEVETFDKLIEICNIDVDDFREYMVQFNLISENDVKEYYDISYICGIIFKYLDEC